MKKQLFIFVMMLLPMMASAVVIDGVYYALDYSNYHAVVTINPNNKYTGDVNIPKSITYNEENYTVTSIQQNAFSGCSDLTSIIIPNSVTTIGKRAFDGCSSLTSITIPNSVTSIGDYAFSGCSSLTSFTIPNSMTSLGNYIFYNCSSITSFTIPNSITSIGNCVFCNCSSLISIIIPNSVTSLGNGVFSGCSGLTTITIPNSVTSFGDFVFQYCSNLTAITLPNNLSSIGKRSFDGCSSLTSLTIPNSVSSIGEYAFYECSSLTSIIIPNGVTFIGDHSFYNCSNLASIMIPNGVTSIGDYTFYYCSSLASMIIPNSVTSIGQHAFYGCNLNALYCYAENAPTLFSSFGYTFNNNAILYVPAASINKYRDADNWKKIKNIYSIESYNLTYYVDNEIYKNFELHAEMPIEPIEAPTKEGYIFSGWSEIPETMPAHDVTVNGSLIFLDQIAINDYLVARTNTSATAQIGSMIDKSISFTLQNNHRDAINVTKVIVKHPETGEVIISSEDASLANLLGVINCGENKNGSITIHQDIDPVYEWYYTWNDKLCLKRSSVVVAEPKFAQGDLDYGINGESVSIIKAYSQSNNLIIPQIVNWNNKDYPITAISNNSFKGNTLLTSITIPNNVTTIGSSAFDGCNNLISVTADIRTPLIIEPNTFSNRTNATLYVPYGSYAAYKVANYWKEFRIILELDSQGKCATPTISYKNGVLTFNCETEGVKYVPTITPKDSMGDNDKEFDLSKTVMVSVYVTKDGYTDSDIATKEIEVRGLKGDVDGDGVVDVNDVQTTINIILKK